MTIDEIRKNYTDPLSSEDVRVILKISKRKASWLLQNGYIKCFDSGKKTRRFTVMIDDLIRYIEQVESGDLIVPSSGGMFTAKETKSHLDVVSFPKNLPVDFRDWLEEEWTDEKDALMQVDIAEMTGYAEKTIRRWVARGDLMCVETQSGNVIPKKSVIDYYCGKGYQTLEKCPKHIDLLKKYFKM
jgi:hypothetical protein